MHVRYNPNTGDLMVHFESDPERKECSVTLERVIEREQRKKIIPVPVCEEGFFEKMA